MLTFYLLKVYLLLLFSRLSNNIRTRTVAGSVSWLYGILTKIGISAKAV